MKSMEEYINEVYEKYEQTKRDNIVYPKVEMPKRPPLIALCSVAACALIVVGVGLAIYSKSLNIEEKQPTEYVENEIINEIINDEKIYTKYIRVDNRMNEFYMKELINSSDIIAIVSGFKLDKIDYVIKNNDTLLKTNGFFKVEKIFKTNNALNNQSINFSRSCGKISLAELEKTDAKDWKNWEVLNFGKEIPKEEKDEYYYMQVPTKGVMIEEGKQYLGFFKYDEEKNIYEVFNLAYGLMEYDPNTNLIKNIETGEFEEFDWSVFDKSE